MTATQALYIITNIVVLQVHLAEEEPPGQGPGTVGGRRGHSGDYRSGHHHYIASHLLAHDYNNTLVHTLQNISPIDLTKLMKVGHRLASYDYAPHVNMWGHL